MTLSAWLRRFHRDFPNLDVPCGTCFACCTGNTAPKTDEKGDCVHLRAGKCSIYAERPVECRSFDCRVFFFTEVTPDHPAIAEKVRKWTAEIKTKDDRILAKRLIANVDWSLPPTARAGKAVGMTK